MTLACKEQLVLMESLDLLELLEIADSLVSDGIALVCTVC